MGTEVTVGIDIGTSSVKAIAADGDGNVVAPRPRPARGRRARARAVRARRRGGVARRTAPPRSAELGDLDVRGVSVAAMVPSLTAVDEQGTPLTPGLLYGDERGRTGEVAQAGTDDASADDASGGFLGFVRWLAEAAPTAHGFWPAQAVANHALRGEAVLDTTTASLAHPLFDWTGWDAAVASELGITPAELPRLVPTGWEAAASVATAPRSRRAASTRWPSSSWPAPTRPATCSCSSAPRSSSGSWPTRAPRCPAT